MKTRSVIGAAGLVFVCGEALAQAAVPESRLDALYGSYAPLVRAYASALMALAVIALVALPFQWLMPAVRRPPKIKTYEFWLDVLYWSQGVWLTLLSFFLVVEWLVLAVYGNGGPLFPALATLPFWAQVLLAIWAFDFAVYWRHRFEHSFSVLWSFHAVHHTAEKVDVLTTKRLHPFEIALGALFNTAVIRLGMDPAAAGLGFAIYLHYNYFIHSNVRIRFPGFLKYVFVSPFMHHWHHAKDDAAMGKNVGVVFAFHDWLFGTAYHPREWPTAFGLAAVPAEQVPQSYLRHTLYPLQFLYARATAWRASRSVKSLAGH